MNDSLERLPHPERTAHQVELELELEDLRVKVSQLVEANSSLVDDNDNLRKACDNLRSQHNRTQGLLDLRDDEIRALRSQLARAAASGAPLPPVSPVTATFSMLSSPSPTSPQNHHEPLPPLPTVTTSAWTHHANHHAHSHAHPNPLQLRASGSRLSRMLRLQQELVGSVRSELMHLAETEQAALSKSRLLGQQASTEAADLAQPADSPILATVTRTHQLTDALERLAESVQVEVDATVAAQQASLDDRVRDLESDLVRARQQGEAHHQDSVKMRAQLDQLTVTAHHNARSLQTANVELNRMTAERDAARSALEKASRQLHRAEDEIRLARDETFRLRRKVAIDSAELDRLRNDLARAYARLPPPPSSVASDMDSFVPSSSAIESRRSSLASYRAQDDIPHAAAPSVPPMASPTPAPRLPTLTVVSRLDVAQLDQNLAQALAPIVSQIEATAKSMEAYQTQSVPDMHVQALKLCNTQLVAAQLVRQLHVAVHSLEVAEATLAHQLGENAYLNEVIRTVTVEKDYLVSEVDLLKRLTELQDPKSGKDHVAWGEFLLLELRRLAQANSIEATGTISPSPDQSSSSPFPAHDAAMTATQVTTLETEIRTLTQYISSILHRVFDQGDQALIEAVLSRRDSGSAATTPPTTPIAATHSRSRPTSSGSAWGSAWRDIASGLLHEASRIRRGSRTSHAGGGVGPAETIGAASTVSALPAVSEVTQAEHDCQESNLLTPPPRNSRRQPSLATMSVKIEGTGLTPTTPAATGTRRPGFFRMFSPLATRAHSSEQQVNVGSTALHPPTTATQTPTVTVAPQAHSQQHQTSRTSWSLFGSTTPPLSPR